MCDNNVRRGVSVWLTGLPSAGKTTLGRSVVQHLQGQGERVELLDGDALRARLGSNLGFSRADREENLRRIAFVAELLMQLRS
jgi:adenylylsulfate kinase